MAVAKCVCPRGWASGGQRDPRCPVHHGQPVIRTTPDFATVHKPPRRPA